jgi:hypothetical protein
MRTTLDIDDDVLAIAKDLAKEADKTAGKVISELVRKSLAQSATRGEGEPPPIFGIRPLPRRGVVVTNELINKIREEEGI